MSPSATSGRSPVTRAAGAVPRGGGAAPGAPRPRLGPGEPRSLRTPEPRAPLRASGARGPRPGESPRTRGDSSPGTVPSGARHSLHPWGRPGCFSHAGRVAATCSEPGRREPGSRGAGGGAGAARRAHGAAGGQRQLPERCVRGRGRGSGPFPNLEPGSWGGAPEGAARGGGRGSQRGLPRLFLLYSCRRFKHLPGPAAAWGPPKLREGAQSLTPNPRTPDKQGPGALLEGFLPGTGWQTGPFTYIISFNP